MAFTPYPNEVYTIFSFFGLLMCIIPLSWHLKAWNVGTCLFMIWAGIGCLIYFVNSIVWHGNALNPAPIWCDISLKVIIGSFTGISASSLCINRRLYLMQQNPGRYFAITKSDKIRSITIDLGISLVLPIIVMILNIVYQGYRFEIREDIGCCLHNHNAWVAVPPALTGFLSATYGILTIISINKRRNRFNEVLALRLNITSSLYFRIMCFAGIEALTTTPIAVSFIVFNMKYPLTSSEYPLRDNRVEQYPAIIWHNFPDASVYEFTRWIHILAAFIFFSIFGFANEARSHYRRAFNFFLKLTGFRIGGRTERPGFQNGARLSVLQSNPVDRLILANKRPRRADSLSTISISHGHNIGKQWSSDAPLNSPTLTTTAVPTTVEQENERTSSGRDLHSFLNLDDNGSSTHHIPLALSSQMDISTVEEGRPPTADRRSSHQISRPFPSFLNLN